MDLISHSSKFLLPTIPADNGPALTYALIILNQRLPRFTPLLWKHAQVRICADGGANRVYDDMPLFFPHEDAQAVRLRYKPNVIKGDLDSIRPDVQNFYSNLGTEIVDASHDQDSTDLHKCVGHILDLSNKEESNLCILAVGALGGRFDHEMGNINVLCRFSRTKGPHCGLIPIGKPSRQTTTTGLEWNLTDSEMSFGGLVSTSNLVKGEVVTVRSDSDLLWTISIKKPDEIRQPNQDADVIDPSGGV